VRALEAALSAAEGLASLGRWLAGGILLAATGLITAEIVLRALFNRSTFAVEEFSGYAMAAMIFLGAAHTLQRGGHIRIRLFSDRLGPGGRLWLERLALAVGVAFASLLLYAFFNLFWDSWSYGTRSLYPSRTPRYLPHGLVLVGIALLWLEFVVLLARSWLHAPSPEEASQEGF
jgi:TRAP-type C4-dicarboxylate transport system permease small subunit